jgi:ubiquinone/menaquinone biosynthesis C-methylase UbiE
MDLSYKEKLDKLQIRIRAHKEFANFDVGDWIDEFVERRKPKSVLDLGCGNGNHLGIYLKHAGRDGYVAGVDRERKLVDEAQETFRAATNLDVRVGSMDERLPFNDASFDLCFSNFAIYNAADPHFTLSELSRVMKSGAELVLIGPTINNARELYDYNERLTGAAIDEITLVRTDRLRREIEPIVSEVFGNAREEILQSRLTFPSAEEFLLYFQSTMLYEEGAEKRGTTREEMIAALPEGAQGHYIVSKEMLAVIARK